jgi:hypothetical protein
LETTSVPRRRDNWERPEFWRNFKSEIWNRQPGVIKGAFSPDFVSTQDVFEGMCRASQIFRQQRKSLIKFYVDNFEMVSGVDPWIPREGEREFAQYSERVRSQLQGKGFGFRIYDFQAHFDWVLWTRFRHFLKGLYQSVGLSPSRSEVELFVALLEFTKTARTSCFWSFRAENACGSGRRTCSRGCRTG